MVIAFLRLKKVQGKKKRDTAARDAEAAALSERTPPEFEEFGGDGEGTGDLLSSKDADVIF
jgi:V-type H+-transporting ATPase subunit D